jgi:hypothetical protein
MDRWFQIGRDKKSKGGEPDRRWSASASGGGIGGGFEAGSASASGGGNGGDLARSSLFSSILACELR